MTTQAESIRECQERTEGIIATRELILALNDVNAARRIDTLKEHAGDNTSIAGFLKEAAAASRVLGDMLGSALARFESAQDTNYREAVRLADFPAEGEDGKAQLAELNAWLSERGFSLGG